MYLGRDIFPVVDAGQFRLRMRAPDGTHIARTEQYAKQALQLIDQEVGAENVDLTLGYVGMIHSNFPVNAVYQWSRGPEEVILYVGLNKQLGIRDEELKERLRKRLSAAMPEVRFSFEPSDIVNEVMSFGSPTPVEIAVNGPAFADDRQYAEKVRQELARIPFLRDLQVGQSLDYPTINVNVDREKAGLAGIEPVDVSRAIVAATSSSRFVVPNYWADPKSGIAYQVQVEIPRSILRKTDGTNTVGSADALAQIPLKQTEKGQVLIGDVATLQPGTMPGQFDRYNMRRQITLTANVSNTDLATVSREVNRALARAGAPPTGVQVDTRGQIPPMLEMQSGLAIGLGLAIVAVFLLLMANFQSVRLALVAVSTAPAVVAGVALMLLRHGNHTEHSVVYRRDHGDRRCHGERDFAGDVRRNPTSTRTLGSGRRDRRRLEPPAGNSDDQLRNDRRHAADGARPGRSGPAKRAVGTSRDRRPDRRHVGHAVCAAQPVFHVPEPGELRVAFARSNRSPQFTLCASRRCLHRRRLMQETIHEIVTHVDRRRIRRRIVNCRQRMSSPSDRTGVDSRAVRNRHRSRHRRQAGAKDAQAHHHATGPN